MRLHSLICFGPAAEERRLADRKHPHHSRRSGHLVTRTKPDALQAENSRRRSAYVSSQVSRLFDVSSCMF